MKLPHALFPLIAIVIGSTIGLAPQSAGASNASAQVALDWNLAAVSAVRAATTTDGVAAGAPPRHLYQTEGLVYMSYVQAAAYDAVMKISHRYQLYHHFKAPSRDASLAAAVISASYHSLVFYLSDPAGTLAAKYESSIAALPPGKETKRGIAVGLAAAIDIERLRAGDGRNAPVSDACPVPANPPTPGAYLCPPSPSIQALQTPWVASMRPFLLRSSSAFRVPPPPSLASETYTSNLAETRAYGAANSSVRTADQQAIALFWNMNVINQFNQTLRDAATQHGMDLVDTERLLTMGEMVTTDAGIACFDSKYHYLFWRPVTAIRADGNPGDANWSPLVATPNHPEYPAAHGCVTSAMGQTLAAALGTENLNVTFPGAANAAGTQLTSRTYATVSDLTSEIVNARVWIGFHYRNSVIAGESLGTAAARWALARYFQPTDEEGDD
ncbi:MAG TPA: vanadium-dependent haloperoxidase [Candidatus Dormibacteraeota bacterium]